MNEQNAMTNFRAAIRDAIKLDQRETFSGREIIEPLLEANREQVVAALAVIVGEEVEAINDESSTQGIITRDSNLTAELVAFYREVSRTLGVPLWFLVRQEPGVIAKCAKAAVLIHGLRAAETQARLDDMEEDNDRLEPVTEGHPDMTVGEAERLLRLATEQTLRNLEGD
jgi:hypothetical protein